MTSSAVAERTPWLGVVAKTPPRPGVFARFGVLGSRVRGLWPFG